MFFAGFLTGIDFGLEMMNRPLKIGSSGPAIVEVNFLAIGKPSCGFTEEGWRSSIAVFGHIPLREPPCPSRQVGEGASPSLDALMI